MAGWQHLFARGAEATWSWDREDCMQEVEVDLRGMRVKHVSVVLEDNGTQQRVKDKIRELEKRRESSDDVTARTILAIKIETLQEVLSA